MQVATPGSHVIQDGHGVNMVYGITWGNGTTTKVHALICSSDSIARPLLRNTKQFNGIYGCDFCYQRGGGPYPYASPEPCLRTEDEHFENAMNATSAASHGS